MRGNSFDLSESGNARVLIGTVAILVINGIFGFGIGCLVRQPIAGIVIVLVWVTVVESLIAGLVEGAARWLPLFSMANVNAQSVSSNSEFMGPVLGALYGAAVALALVALGAVRIRSMDA